MRSQLYDHIIADPDILGGKPVIAGTQIPASDLVARVATGKSLAAVARELGVRVEDVRAALEYAARLAEEPPAACVSAGRLAGDAARAKWHASAADEEARRVGLDPAQLSPLGRCLLEARARGIAAGEPPITTWEELDAEIRDRRGGVYPDAD